MIGPFPAYRARTHPKGKAVTPAALIHQAVTPDHALFRLPLKNTALIDWLLSNPLFPRIVLSTVMGPRPVPVFSGVWTIEPASTASFPLHDLTIEP